MSSSREETVATLLSLFREQGYDGASMSEVSSVTGLGKSSLYHHFPGGKAEMAKAVLEHLDALLKPAFDALDDARPTPQKLDQLLEVIDRFYDSGRLACVLERLCASVDRRLFAKPLKATFTAIARAFEKLCRQEGLSPGDSARRAEEAVVNIEGSLIVAAGVGDAAVFTRALERIRERLLAPASHKSAQRSTR